MSDTAPSVARDRGPSARLQRYLQEGRERVDAALEAVLPGADQEPAELHRAMRHAVFAGGKRLRPLLLIASGRACGADEEALLPAACAVELIHTYSLIHDDLPAFDDEELRRGQPTCHVLFGDAVAILAGDALQALAFEVLAGGGGSAVEPYQDTPVAGDAGRRLAASRVIARAAGSLGMCGGQTLDIRATGNRLSLEQLRALHAAKTGALLTASVLAGGLLAGAGSERLAALRAYGDAVGLAFQIVDDLLDVEGDVQQLGKRPGGDAARGQPTYPSLLGVRGARSEALRLRDCAIQALTVFGEEAWPLRDLAAYIVARSS